MSKAVKPPLKLSAKTLRRLTEPEMNAAMGATDLGCQTSLITITISIQYCSQPPNCIQPSATGGYSCAKLGSCCGEEE